MRARGALTVEAALRFTIHSWCCEWLLFPSGWWWMGGSCCTPTICRAERSTTSSHAHMYP